MRPLTHTAYFPPQSPTPPPPLPPARTLSPPLPPPPTTNLSVKMVSSLSSELDGMPDAPCLPTLADKAPTKGFENDIEEMAVEEVSSMENNDLAFPPTSPPPFSIQDKLVFNFLYNNNSLQQTESRGEMRCPWCHRYCEKLYSLLKHMSLSHPRFHYTYTVCVHLARAVTCTWLMISSKWQLGGRIHFGACAPSPRAVLCSQ